MGESPTTIVDVAARARSQPRILRNVISNWTAFAVTLIVNFFLSPFVVHHLGNTGYGVWTLIVSLTGYLGLLDFGVRGAVTRYVTKFHTLGEDDNASRVASSGLLLFMIAGLLAITVATVLAFLAAGHFRIPTEYRGTARIVLLLAGANIAASLVGGVFGGIVVSQQRFDLLNGVDISVTGLRAISIVGALYSGKGLIALACIQLGFTLLRGFTSALIARHLYPTLHVSLSKADRTYLKIIFSFSFYSFLIAIGADLIYSTDTIVIGAFLPVTMITFFVIASNLLEYTRTLLTAISYTASPLASQLDARGDQKGLQEVVLTSCRFATAVALPVITTFLIRGGTFIGLWMGPQYVSLSWLVLRILALMMFFTPGVYPAGAIMLGISRHKPLVLVRMGEGVANLALSVILVRRMGIIGVAWGTTIPGILFAVGYWPWFLKRTLGLNPLQYALSSWVRPWISIAPFAVLTYVIERKWRAGNLAIFFSQVAAALPVALIAIWFGCVERQHREKYLKGFTQFVTRVFLRGGKKDE
jgi:O-antigen/teichoic acid export membrane protein